jgi:hypothetical protein
MAFFVKFNASQIKLYRQPTCSTLCAATQTLPLRPKVTIIGIPDTLTCPVIASHKLHA